MIRTACKAFLKAIRMPSTELTLLYSFRRCCAEVMAPSTDCLFTRLLMFDAVPNSSPSIFCTRETWTTATGLSWSGC